jgi:hypothetical protein
MPAQTDQQQQPAQDPVDRAHADGVKLVGPGGLPTGLTKTAPETALEAQRREHLGYDKHDPAGRKPRELRLPVRPRSRRLLRPFSRLWRGPYIKGPTPHSSQAKSQRPRQIEDGAPSGGDRTTTCGLRAGRQTARPAGHLCARVGG